MHTYMYTCKFICSLSIPSPLLPSLSQYPALFCRLVKRSLSCDPIRRPSLFQITSIMRKDSRILTVISGDRTSPLHLHIYCIPLLCTYYVHTMCTYYVYILRVHIVCTYCVYILCVHIVCTYCVYVLCVHIACTYMYMYMYVYIYEHTHMYMYIHVCVCALS